MSAMTGQSIFQDLIPSPLLPLPSQGHYRLYHPSILSLYSPLPSILPLEVGPLKSRYGFQGSPSQNQIWCILALKYDTC